MEPVEIVVDLTGRGSVCPLYDHRGPCRIDARGGICEHKPQPAPGWCKLRKGPITVRAAKEGE